MMRFGLALAAAVLVVAVPAVPSSAGAAADSVGGYHGLTGSQRAELRQIARDTWQFYNVAVDPTTHLPLDNVTFANGAPSVYGR